MENQINKPRVFIAYASDDAEYQKKVIEFAKKLCECGIEILLDIWDLKEGHDINAFMEACVTDSSVTNVLVLLDPFYAKKADDRKGGVGTETQFISMEVYQDVEQDKFIPIVMKRDENGKICKPTYLKSRRHFDLSIPKSYDCEFRRLVNRLYGVEVKKPALGDKPDWVNVPIETSHKAVSEKKNSEIDCLLNEDVNQNVRESGKPSLEIIIDESKLEQITSEYKAQIKNETLLPWIKNTILANAHLSYKAVFPTLFIMPNLKSVKQNSLIDNAEMDTDILLKHLITTNQGQNIIVTGDAGIGKSTLLKHIFLRQDFLCKDIQNAPQFYYLKATEYISISKLDKRSNCNNNQSDKSEKCISQYIKYVKDLLDNGQTDNDNKIVVLLDCIDEAYLDTPRELNSLISNIRSLSNVHVWFGWRQEHLNKNRTAMLNRKIEDIIVLQDWDSPSSDKYVKKYSNILNKKQIADRYNEIKQNANISDFSKNPFQLTLLLFLLEYPFEINDSWGSISLYNLYNIFVELWIKKENQETNTNDIFDILISASKDLYYGKVCHVTDNRPVICDLFHFSYRDNIVNEFCHRSLASFFLAKNILDLITGTNDINDLKQVLQKPLNNDVTQFIRSAVNSYEDDVILSMQKKLQNLYFDVSMKGEKNTQSSEEDDNCLSVKNAIVYLTTRLRNINNIATKFLQKICNDETDIRMKVTISYGAAKLGLQDIAKKFAEEYYYDDSELEKTTRSFSLVYYQDVSSEELYQKGLYKYQDDGKVSWKNSRNIRLKNLLSEKKQDKDFRILDIPLLYCFYKSRNWKDVNIEDYNKYINTIEIDKASYTTEVYEFLIEKTKLFQEEYLKALLCNGKYSTKK